MTPPQRHRLHTPDIIDPSALEAPFPTVANTPSPAADWDLAAKPAHVVQTVERMTPATVIRNAGANISMPINMNLSIPSNSLHSRLFCSSRNKFHLRRQRESAVEEIQMLLPSNKGLKTIFNANAHPQMPPRMIIEFDNVSASSTFLQMVPLAVFAQSTLLLLQSLHRLLSTSAIRLMSATSPTNA